MLNRLYEKQITQTSVITTDYTEGIDLSVAGGGSASTLSVQSFIDVNTPAGGAFASTDVNTTNDTIAIATPTFVTGTKGQFTTTGTLPTGISALTDYFVIVVSTGVYAFATSLANAQAGTKVNITGAGSGNSTFTPTAFAGGSISYQRTNVSKAGGDGPSTTATDWDDIDTATTITADGHVWFTKIGPEYRYFRIKTTSTAGQMTNNHYVLIKGEDKS